MTVLCTMTNLDVVKTIQATDKKKSKAEVWCVDSPLLPTEKTKVLPCSFLMAHKPAIILTQIESNHYRKQMIHLCRTLVLLL